MTAAPKSPAVEAEVRETERPYLRQAEAVTIAILNGYYRSHAITIDEFGGATTRLRDFIVLGVEQALAARNFRPSEEALKKRVEELEVALMDHVRCFDRPDKNPIVLPWWTKTMTERRVPKNSAAIQAAAVQIEGEVRAKADAVLRSLT